MDVWACGAEEEVAGCGDGRRQRRWGAAMMSRWRLREQVFAMIADEGWRRTRWHGGGNVVARLGGADDAKLFAAGVLVVVKGVIEK